MNEEIRLGMIKMLGDDPDLLKEIYADYVGEAQKALVASADCLAKHDLKALRAVAHTLKGCSANVGAEKLRQVSFDWQLAAEAGDEEKCKSCREQVAELVKTL